MEITVAKRILAIILSVATLLGCIVFSASSAAGDTVKVSAVSATVIPLADYAKAIEFSTSDNGNLSIAKGEYDDSFYDGVRKGDAFEVKVDVPSAGTYSVSFGAAWPQKDPNFDVTVNGTDTYKGNNQNKGTNFRKWFTTTPFEIELQAGVNTLLATSTGNSCVYSINLVPAGVDSKPLYPSDNYDTSVQNGTGTREPVRVGNSLSYRAIVNASFTGFGITMPTWMKKDSKATLSIYKWKGTYSKTVAEAPVASKRFEPLNDGSVHWVTFDALSAGEYLFHVSEPYSDVGVYTNVNPTGSEGFFYVDGVEQYGEPELYVRFNEKVVNPFGQCKPSVDINIAKNPITSSANKTVTELPPELGVRLDVGASFSGFKMEFGTYMATDIGLTYRVYEWKGSYKNTVSAGALAEERITLKDNAMQGIVFDELPAGEYLFVVADADGNAALYCYPSVTKFEGYVYKSGIELEQDMIIYPSMQVIFSEELSSNEDYFIQCKPSGDTITGEHTSPPEYVIPDDSLIYTHPVMPDTWVFTDGLGRVSYTNADVGDPRDNKSVAMFYWTWHIDGFSQFVPTNVNKIIEQYPEAKNDYNHPVWQNELADNAYWWNESIYGYYKTSDPWVIRRQGELLANAGVDVIFTDNTNGASTWRNSYVPMFETWSDAMEDGVLTPKISFMLPFGDKNYTLTQLSDIYLDVFRQGKWQELWFYWDEKPMMMAHSYHVDPNSSKTMKEIANFFTFRSNEPEYIVENPKLGWWGWLSMYPQAVYYKNAEEKAAGNAEQITVGVAMNHNYKLHSLTAMNGENIAGRSYTSTFQNRYDVEGKDASLLGYNFSEQFDYALEVDPEMVFVTGWNEWRVGRYKQWPDWNGNPAPVNNAFPDQFNDDFSRDIEPSTGALKDHYYYLLVNYVRKYKGVRAIPAPSEKVYIDLNAGYEQWQNVEPYYAAYIGNTEDRNAEGYGDVILTEFSGRNDIIGAQVARDDEYVYFLVECADNITPYSDNLWMNLYIDTDQSDDAKGWESFEYVVNKTKASESTSVLERFTGEGYASEKVADVEYKVDGRYMTVKIARSDLGLNSDDFTVNFSWTDNVHDADDKGAESEGDTVYSEFSGDILDFYVSGDVAPGGRFKYSFISTVENAGESVIPPVQSGDTTAPESGETTSPDSENAETTAPDSEGEDTVIPDVGETTSTPDGETAATPAGDTTDAPAGETTSAEAETAGCKSVVGVASVAMTVAVVCAAAALGKRRED